jgi:hypothetical protein
MYRCQVHIAQVNIALPREPLDAPLLRGFVAALEPVNAGADEAPGFVWRRREWFVKHAEAFQVLWWIPEGHIPTVDEAEFKLAHLREHGPTPDAFTSSTADLCPA